MAKIEISTAFLYDRATDRLFIMAFHGKGSPSLIANIMKAYFDKMQEYDASNVEFLSKQIDTEYPDEGLDPSSQNHFNRYEVEYGTFNSLEKHEDTIKCCVKNCVNNALAYIEKFALDNQRNSLLGGQSLSRDQQNNVTRDYIKSLKQVVFIGHPNLGFPGESKFIFKESSVFQSIMKALIQQVKKQSQGFIASYDWESETISSKTNLRNPTKFTMKAIYMSDDLDILENAYGAFNQAEERCSKESSKNFRGVRRSESRLQYSCTNYFYDQENVLNSMGEFDLWWQKGETYACNADVPKFKEERRKSLIEQVLPTLTTLRRSSISPDNTIQDSPPKIHRSLAGLPPLDELEKPDPHTKSQSLIRRATEFLRKLSTSSRHRVYIDNSSNNNEDTFNDTQSKKKRNSNTQTLITNVSSAMTKTQQSSITSKNTANTLEEPPPSDDGDARMRL